MTLYAVWKGQLVKIDGRLRMVEVLMGEIRCLEYAINYAEMLAKSSPSGTIVRVEL